MPPRTRPVVLLALAFALLGAGPAAAETLTVDPADPNNGCTRGVYNTCRTIAQALAAATAGDTIKILTGVYAESPTLPAGKPGLTIQGAGLAATRIVGTGGGDVLTIAGSDASVSDLGLEVPGGAQSALVVSGGNARVSGVYVNRTAGGDFPAVAVVSGGSLLLERSYVIQRAGTGTAGVASTSTGGLKLLDTVVASFQGPGATMTESVANDFTRSTVVSVASGGDGVVLTSASGSSAPKKLRTDSSVISAPGTGLRVGSGAGTPFSTAGPITLDIRHSTISANRGMLLDASPALANPLSGPAGSITATVSSSIVHGASQVDRNTTPAGGNTASLTFADSDAPPATGTGTHNAPQYTTPDSKLFVPGKLRLRADAPVIDKGGPVAATDSQTDIDGDPRVVGPASDIGADEFLNLPPRAALHVTKVGPRQNEAIGFISDSTDPEQGTGDYIAEYRWNFGDGTTESTKFGAAVHAYASTGTYRATLVAVDAFGAASAPSEAVTVTVTDASAPTVAIVSPADGARLVLAGGTRKARKGRRKPASRELRPKPLKAAGTAAHPAGVASVEVALTLMKRAPKARAKARGRRGASHAAKACEQYTGTGFRRARCDRPIFLAAALRGAEWTFSTTKSRLRLPPGIYELRARATNRNGVVSATFAKAEHTLVTFRIL